MSSQKKAEAFNYWVAVFKGCTIHFKEITDDRDYEHHESPSKVKKFCLAWWFLLIFLFSWSSFPVTMRN